MINQDQVSIDLWLQKTGPADTLSTIHQDAKACIRCPIHANMGQCPLYRGNPGSPIVVIGEKSGMKEAQAGYPFAGGSGWMLERLLKSTGLSPWNDVWATNMTLCHLGEDRAPTARELTHCQWWQRLVEAFPPKMILAAGRIPVQVLCGHDPTLKGKTLETLHGRTFSWHGIVVIATFNPAYVIRLQTEHPDRYEQVLRVWRTTIRTLVRQYR